ncbi:putative cytokinetic ring protein SteA [Nocardioides panzhihuensis]|uniref:Putative membrane-anchored protein n=1 Tax=Nocardioides panzhihuensis TaxID=860243 RepID=A0A7Z0IRV9_9ACTN|nr:putative cytokinetic ring protein SteA [Nocardioides panzhihuensis]NYI77210.1 putative membrane-anchored protein [Nocardioides panzhihuensis]
MRLPTRQIPSVLPGLRGTLRTGRPTRALVPRLKEGDIAVIDHIDLDRSTALAIAATGVVAVVNAQPMVSGRYPNRGPKALADAGIELIDQISDAGLEKLVDGRKARILDGEIFDGERLLASGRALDQELLESELENAKRGLSSHLELFTHNSSELLRREEEVLLHGRGVPPLDTPLAGRPVVVVADHPELDRLLRDLEGFLREQRPTIIAVGPVAKRLTKKQVRHAVLVLGADTDTFPEPKVLTGAAEVVLAPGGSGSEQAAELLDRVGVQPKRFDSSLAPEDAALLIAYAQHPSLVVGAGLSTTLTDFLEDQRPGLAGTYLTRLALGPTLIDASAVPAVRRKEPLARRLVLPVLTAVTALAIGLPAGVWAADHGLTGRGLSEIGAGAGGNAGAGDTVDTTSGQSGSSRTETGSRQSAEAQFVAEAGDALLPGKLAGQKVAVVTFPGADRKTVDALTGNITAAGADMAGVLDVRPNLLDPDRKQYVDSLATQLVDQLGRGDGDQATYQRMGQVIGETYAGRKPPAAFDKQAKTAAVALLTGDLVKAHGRPTGPADLVLVVLGEDNDDSTAVEGLTDGLGATTKGLVVAGTTDSGDLAALRANDWPGWFASVDGIESSTGQIVAPLALARQKNQEGGEFGASGFGGLLKD